MNVMNKPILLFALLVATLTLIPGLPAGAQPPSAGGEQTVEELNDQADQATRKDPRQAMELARRALEMARKENDRRSEARAQLILGQIYWHLNIYDKALDCGLKSMSISETIGEDRITADGLNLIGLVYDSLGDPDKSFQYHRQALQLRRDIGDREGEAKSLNNLGLVYDRRGNDSQALEFHQKALDIFREIHHQLGISFSLANMGTVYEHREEYRRALDFYFESLKIRRSTGENWATAYTLDKIASLYMKLKQNQRALPYIREGLALARKIDAPDLLKNCYFNLAQYYRSRGDFRNALDHYQRYVIQKDKLFNTLNQKKITEMQVKHEIETKEKEIELLKKNRLIQDLENKRRTILAYLLLLIILLILTLMGVLMKKYRHLLFFWKKKNFIGPYKLVDRIATGGMATIYRAQNVLEKSRGFFALKVIKDELSRDEKLKKRFKHEASMIDQLDHPGIVKIYERGEHEGQIYMVMELLAGETLSAFLKENQKIPYPTVINIMAQLCEVLEKIHQKDIVHRDLKPENIMIIPTSQNPFTVKLLDFGLARSQAMSRLTRSDRVLGTPLYASPEQISGLKITPKSDVFSLGIILYEMLAGENPFGGRESVLQTLKGILMDEVDSLIPRHPRVPPQLNSLVIRMLNKEPDQRPDMVEVSAFIGKEAARMSAARAAEGP